MDKNYFRSLIKHYFLKGKTAKETKEKLDKYYVANAPSDYTVKYWFREFRGGRNSTTDEIRSGRPSDAVTEENVKKIHEMVLADRKVKVRELADATKISTERTRHILGEILHMKKLSCRWVPRMLTPDQKHERESTSKEDNKVQTEKEVRKHGNMLPISIRGVCGSSNCCKTNVISLLESPHGLRFENVYVYSKALLNSIFVFDDVACDKQDAIREYFAMGMWAVTWVDCFYLCQTYAKISNYLLRDNANLLILFKQDDTNLKHVYNDHVNTDMSYEDFCELCRCCCNKSTDS
ncbi:SETMR methyltransferase, partial [Acromyrmex insinuator]